MASKLVILSVLLSCAVVHSAKLNTNKNTDIISSEKEERTLEIPVLGLLIWKISHVGWFLVSNLFNLIGWKTALVGVVATVAIHVAFWAYENLFSFVLGAVAMLGFCKLTGKCSLQHVPAGLIEVGENLYYAAKNLNSGIALYDK